MNSRSEARGALARPTAQSADIAPALTFGSSAPVHRAAHPGQFQAQGTPFSPITVLRALRRRGTLALGIAVVSSGIAGPSAWFFVPPSSFKAEARLQVATQPPKVLFATVETQNAGSDYARYQNTQKTLVKSRLVLSAALADPSVARCRMVREQADPMEWLGEKLKVDFVANSEVMEISLAGSQPTELACIVNAVKQAYMDEVVLVDAKRRAGRHEHLKKLKETYSRLLQSKLEIRRKLAETVGSDDRSTLALRQQYAEEHVHSLRMELMSIQSQKRKLEAQLRNMGRIEGDQGESDPEVLSESTIDRMVEEHPAVVELVKLLANQQEKLDSAKAKAYRISRRPVDEPGLRALSSDVGATRRLLASRRKELRPEVIRQAREHGAGATGSDRQDLGRDLRIVADLELRLEDEIQRLSQDNHKLNVNTLNLQGTQEETAQMQATADKIAAEVEALNVEVEAPPRIRPIDDASVPHTRDDKKRYMLIGFITFGSFFGGLFGVAFLEVQTRKVDSADDVPAELGLAVVGGLPILPSGHQQRGAIEQDETEKARRWRNLLLESVDATRTLLLHAARTGSHRLIMISSAMEGEGKTSLASYLSTSLARGGLRTLVIDADLRRPMLHRLFDLPASPGLSELLRGEVSIDESLAATAVEDLTLMAAGRCDRQALRSLSQGGLGPLFDQLKQRFDFIIVDTSPILPVADALLIAQHSDAAIFSIFRDVSRKTKVKLAIDRLQRLGVPLLGAVVTGAHGGVYGHDYYDPYSAYCRLPESVATTPNPS